MRFLRENWIWIAAPIALVLIAFVAMIAMKDGGDASPFIYTID